MDLTKSNIRKICLIITFAVLLVLAVLKIDPILTFGQTLLSTISPLIIGACIAFIVNLPMTKIENFLEKYIIKKPTNLGKIISMLLAFLFIVAIGGVVVVLIVPQIESSINTLLPKIGPFLDDVSAWIMGAFNDPFIIEQLEGLELNWQSISNSIMTVIRDIVPNFFSNIFIVAGSFVGLIIKIVVSIVFSVYILLSKETLAKQIKMVMQAFLSPKRNKSLLEIFSLSNETFAKFIAGQCTEAIILGTIFFITLTLIGMPYALLISVLISVTSIIPVVGAFMGCAIGAFLILIENPMQALIFIIAFLIIQQIEGNLIYPRVVGSSIGIPPILMLLAVTVGGSMWGIGGILFFIPITAIAYSMLKTATFKRLDEQKEDNKKE